MLQIVPGDLLYRATVASSRGAILLCLLAAGFPPNGSAVLACEEQVTAHMRLEATHPWRPPFGIARVGQPPVVSVELRSAVRPVREYALVSKLEGREISRQVLNLAADGNAFFERVQLAAIPDEVVLLAKCRFQGEEQELLRSPVQLSDLSLDAVAKADTVINPVDLGAVLVPSDWLLLAAGQRAMVDVAAFSTRSSIAGAEAVAYLESSALRVTKPFSITAGKRQEVHLVLGPVLTATRKDVLHVVMRDAQGREFFHKKIPTMFVAQRPPLPTFGAVETKLRYDAPISIRDSASGRLSHMDYDAAWSPELKDVVVALPNGSRFVFWRGSSYVPFWAGQRNTGFSYEWAETTPPPDGFVDSVEPLMDKELRYGRVKILESTAARVRVLWTYQSTDFNYKVWGDEAEEEFTFYPDGFGTRTLRLRSAPGADYELSEFIILTAQATYPLAVLPKELVQLLYLDGTSQVLSFPYHPPAGAASSFAANKLVNARQEPVIYRVRVHQEEAAQAIYFCPHDLTMPIAYAPFYDRGVLVTPAYWGSHWPLGRGKSTGWTIDDRIDSNPGHNSILTWGMSNRPKPERTEQIETIDTLGQAKTMTVQQWTWLIAMTDASNQELIDRARSFSQPPSVSLAGAHLDFNAYDTSRRAIHLVADKPAITVQLKPAVPCVDPVFVIDGTSGQMPAISLNGKRLEAGSFAWDGHTLWLRGRISAESRLELLFGKGTSRVE